MQSAICAASPPRKAHMMGHGMPSAHAVALPGAFIGSFIYPTADAA